MWCAATASSSSRSRSRSNAAERACERSMGRGGWKREWPDLKAGCEFVERTHVRPDLPAQDSA